MSPEDQTLTVDCQTHALTLVVGFDGDLLCRRGPGVTDAAAAGILQGVLDDWVMEGRIPILGTPAVPGLDPVAVFLKRLDAAIEEQLGCNCPPPFMCLRGVIRDSIRRVVRSVTS